jgi:uncharacterized protein (DUF1501 family)
MSCSCNQNRRQFLRTASMASMAGIYVSPFLLELNSLAAMAQSTPGSDYRALVCVYLQGGNDGHGTVIATDPESFAAFTAARSGAPGLAYPMSELLPITLKTPQSGRTFALNPSLGGVQSLFNAGRAAIVANTGTLVTPATKTQINSNSVPLPDSLFSHFDQTAAWQAIASNLGSERAGGLGRRSRRRYRSHEHELQLHVHLHLHRRQRALPRRPIFVSAQRHFRRPHSHLRTSEPPFGLPSAANPLNSILTADETNLFAQEYEIVVNRSMQAQATLVTAMAPAGVGGVANPPQYLDPMSNKLADNPLAASMQTVARIIAGRAQLGVTRQIFYVQLGSFDTHNNQAVQHAQLLTQLGAAFQYFDGLMVGMGLGNNVTAFTISDFGRTLTSNSNGTDHGWGSHHFVVGGAVQGQDMYGQYPVVGVDQANDVGAGRLIPTTAVEQYAGTLASWFGLSDSQIRTVFPNFGNFGTDPYLGFMS